MRQGCTDEDPETQVVLPCFAIWILLHCRGMIPGRLEKFFHCRSPTPNLQSNVVQVLFALLQKPEMSISYMITPPMCNTETINRWGSLRFNEKLRIVKIP